jgi:hypothetical protein
LSEYQRDLRDLDFEPDFELLALFALLAVLLFVALFFVREVAARIALPALFMAADLTGFGRLLVPALAPSPDAARVVADFRRSAALICLADFHRRSRS